jgi:outer membrane lipoprotein-sorting protein
MTLFNRRPALRWLVPLVAVIGVTTAGSVAAAITASARDSLPPRSAAQLLVDVQKAQLNDGLSGTIVQSASLGLPSLPGLAGDQSSNFSSLVSGSHTLRVWYAGPQRARVALIGQLGESDIVRNGSDVWIWSSHDNTARHLTVPAGAGDSELKSKVTSSDEAMTPQQAADTALKAITPTTRVSTDATAVVAGRSAYQLVLEPRDPATLIGTVTIAIDGDTHVPIRVQVFARGATSPAFETGFTSFNPSTPPSSVFDFNPPPGATVTDGIGGSGTDRAGSGTFESSTKNSKPEIVGKGWTSIIKADLPTTSDTSSNASSEPGSSNPLGSLDAVVKSLPTVSGTWGSGHLLRGTLFSVLITDNGQVVAGAVAPDRLYAALAAQ